MTRLDTALVERGLAPAREKAKELIREGKVFCDGAAVLKASALVTENTAIEIRGETLKYVGRGGLKLEYALRVFGISLSGCGCADLGASTGGFTDCMLRHGANLVYAIDVGSGQLAEKLRADPRVISMERTNIRTLDTEALPVQDFAAADLSFISLGKIYPVIFRLLREGGQAVCLVKPQFEAGRAAVGKRGIVKKPEVHERVLQEACRSACEAGFSAIDCVASPIRGGDGNVEFLLHLRRDGLSGCKVTAERIRAVVDEARRKSDTEEPK